MTEKVHYISNEELHDAIKNYHETKKRVYYNKIGKAFIHIANKLIESSTFNRFPDDMKEAMVSEGYCKMIVKLEKYDHLQYSNPFSYFTSVAFNVFRQHIKKYYKGEERTISLEQYMNSNNILVKDDKYLDKIDSNRVRTNNTNS